MYPASLNAPVRAAGAPEPVYPKSRALPGGQPRRLSQHESCEGVRESLHAPEIIFLLLIVMVLGRDGDTEGVGLRRHRKRPHWFGTRAGSGRDRRGQRLEQRSRRSGWLVSVADRLQKVMIFDMFDLVGQADEAAVDVIEGAAVELIAELFAADGEGVTAGVLAEYESGIGHADGLRGHVFVGQRVLENAILVDAGFVGEGVASDDGLVGLHGHAGDLAQQLAGGEQMFGSDGSFVGIAIVTNAEGHDNFFERGIAGALADAIDGAFNLAGSGGDGSHGVGYSHAEIVVAVSGDGDVLDSLHAAADGGDQVSELGGHGVTDGVRDIERRGAGFDYSIKDLAQELGVGARCVFGRKFDVGAERFREGDGFAGLGEALLAGDAKLVLQVMSEVA